MKTIEGGGGQGNFQGKFSLRCDWLELLISLWCHCFLSYWAFSWKENASLMTGGLTSVHLLSSSRLTTIFTCRPSFLIPPSPPVSSSSMSDPTKKADTNSSFSFNKQYLCSSSCHVDAVLPRLVDSLVVRLRLCWGSPGPVPGAWLCVWGGGEDEMETWEPVLLPWFSSFSRSFSAFSFSISSCR